MRKFLFIILDTFLCVCLSCVQHGQNQDPESQVPDSIAPFLELFYGMDKDEQGNYVDSILDTIPGLLKFEKSAMWCNPEDSMKYNASMGLYIDTVFPSQKIESELLSLADSLLRVDDSDNSVWDAMPRFDACGDSVTTSSFLEFWSNLYDKVAVAKAPPKHSAFPQVLDFRWCTVIHKIYEDENVTTYLVGESWDVHGSCGCPSKSSYLTFDKTTGSRLTVSDVVDHFKEGEIENLLRQRYCSASKENGYEPTDITGKRLISEADGVAQIGNLYLFYYHPYKIGCGAEGQYNLFVPIHNI